MCLIGKRLYYVAVDHNIFLRLTIIVFRKRFLGQQLHIVPRLLYEQWSFTRGRLKIVFFDDSFFMAMFLKARSHGTRDWRFVKKYDTYITRERRLYVVIDVHMFFHDSSKKLNKCSHLLRDWDHSWLKSRTRCESVAICVFNFYGFKKTILDLRRVCHFLRFVMRVKTNI
jgi:hypothetical protein